MGEEALKLAVVQEKPFDIDDFTTYKVGVVISEGETISGVLSVGDGYIIYTIAESYSVTWSARGIPVSKSAKITEVDQLLAEADHKLKGIHSHKINSLYVSALCCVLEDHDEAIYEKTIQAFRDEIDSIVAPLKVIYASRRAYIWVNDDLSLEYLIKRQTELERYAIEQFGQMEAYRELICPDTLSRADVKKMTLSLGVALHSALNQSEKEQIDKIFEGFKERVSVFVANTVKSKYLLLTVSFGAILISAFFIAYSTDFLMSKVVLPPVIGGVLGALLSTVSRSNSIKVSEQNPDHIILLQGGLRVLVGGAFAFVGFACVEAGLALGVFKGELYSLLVLGVVCGFSERLVPDLIGGLSSAK
jgi:hypothetical protein